jgi:hypothetical protein
MRGPGSRLVACLLLPFLLAAQSPPRGKNHLHWNELSPLIVGKRVWLSLPDGERISGVVHAIQTASLDLDIAKTSDKMAYPKGLAVIPRSAVTTIRVNKPSGHKGLIIGGAIGAGIAAAAAGTLAVVASNEGGNPLDAVIAAVIIAPVAIGLLAGWLIDTAAHRGGFTITVIPD